MNSGNVEQTNKPARLNRSGGDIPLARYKPVANSFYGNDLQQGVFL